MANRQMDHVHGTMDEGGSVDKVDLANKKYRQGTSEHSS